MQPVWSVGLMTGTVLDGNIDVALLKTDGESVFEFGYWEFISYPPETNLLIRKAMSEAQSWNFANQQPSIFQEAEYALTIAQANAVKRVVHAAGISMDEVAVIGFHGQTVLHQPPQNGALGQSRQLGDGNLMAEVLGCKVAYDFRTQDMLNGGQGAPLSPIYHTALLKNAGLDSKYAVINLGGVANLTWWNGNEIIIGFDTGPANAPINDWISSHGLGPFDRDGKFAEIGDTDEPKLKRILSHPYFTQIYPKSIDRNSFTQAVAKGLSVEDGASTLTAFCAEAIDRGLEILPTRPETLILCGGGRKNPTLTREIELRTESTIIMADSLGWRGDALEAECFAFLAVRVLRDLPISFPTTTGIPHPSTGGRLAGAST